MASEIHSIHPAPAPPRMWLWHHRHPAKTDTKLFVLNKHTHTHKHLPPYDLSAIHIFIKALLASALLYRNDKRWPLTHFISTSVKRCLPINMRSGIVRMSMKGSARDTGLDLTIHKTARHTIWMAVNKCIRPVLTCDQHEEILVRQTWLQMRKHFAFWCDLGALTAANTRGIQ